MEAILQGAAPATASLAKAVVLCRKMCQMLCGPLPASVGMMAE